MMKKIFTDDVIDHKPKDIFIADLFREEIMSGRLKRGDKLLPDDKIARKYKLNKRTVASGLNILVEDGLLFRAPRRGTIVIKDYSSNGDPESPEKDEFNNYDMPSLYGMEHLFFIPETKVLTFALFETFPKQKMMWECLIDKFNSKSKGRKVEPEFIPFELFARDGVKLRKHLLSRDKRPDIVQCLLCNVSPSLLADLPDDLIEYACGEQGLGANVLPDFKDFLRKMVPVYTSAPVCIWNQEMAETYGIESLKKNIIEGNLVKTLCTSLSRFPTSVEKIGPHLDNLLRHYGLPGDLNTIDTNYFFGFFDGILKDLRLIDKRYYKKIFIENFGYKSVRNFSRRRHFLLETLVAPPYHPDKEYLDFKLGSSIYPPKNDLPMEISSLGIGAESAEPEFAADFLRFTVSHESQLFIHSCINGIPYRKSALEALPEINPQMTAEEINLLCDKLKFYNYPWLGYFNTNFIALGMNSLFNGVISGKINSSSEAADIAYQIFDEQLKKKEIFSQ